MKPKRECSNYCQCVNCAVYESCTCKCCNECDCYEYETECTAQVHTHSEDVCNECIYAELRGIQCEECTDSCNFEVRRE